MKIHGFSCAMLMLLISVFSLTGCGFHLQGKAVLPPYLQKIYLETNDPYGDLANNLRQNLTESNVTLTEKENATVILKITQDSEAQELLSVSGSQQTRQYNLIYTTSFELLAKNGRTIMPTQTITEKRTITTQSNQILGSGNEAALYYQQMRLIAARAIMDRLASLDVKKEIHDFFTAH